MSPRIRKLLCLAAVPVVSCLQPALAIQVAPDAPAAGVPITRPAATAPAHAQALEVVVTEVRGLVQVRAAAGEEWKRPAVGQTFGAGAEFRTGSRSSVTLAIGDDQVITLDRLGTMSVLEALRQGNKVTTDLVLRYGRTDYAIEAAGREHDARIRTPSATLSVRGTRFIASDQPPFAPECYTVRGLVDYRFARRLTSVGQGGRARGGSGSTEVSLNSSAVDPSIAAARTSADASLIANEQSRGAVVNYDPNAEIATARGSRGRSDATLMGSLPGRLNFIVRWDSPADVNLALIHQAGDPLELLGFFTPQEFLYPGFRQNVTPSGGRITVDNRGGPEGGSETAFWEKSTPTGIYGLQALHVSGAATNVTMNAFIDGAPLPLTTAAVDEAGNVITEPLTLPDGTVVQAPVLETRNQIVRRLEPQGAVVANATNPPIETAIDDFTGNARAAPRAAAPRPREQARARQAAERSIRRQQAAALKVQKAQDRAARRLARDARAGVGAKMGVKHRR